MRQSTIAAYEHCQYSYKLRYLDKLETIKLQDANDPRYLGTAIHYGAETGSIQKMLENYYSNYYVLNDKNINEAIKIEYLLPKVLNFINQYEKLEHEVSFKVGSFTGTADLLAHNEDGTVDLYDYKYSNNTNTYCDSPQLHLYKYFLEKIGYKVRKMAFIFIPKTFIRQKNNEDLYTFRKRLNKALSVMDITVMYLDYDENKVIEALNKGIEMLETTEFKKNTGKDCKFCEFEKLCLKEINYMVLPENKRVTRIRPGVMDKWIYGPSYGGKTTFMDKFEDVLFLNTDGNIDNITSPVLRIKNEMTTEGRMTSTKLAWSSFLEIVSELEKKDNTFKRIVLDLTEDLYEHCRLFIFDREGIQHESDSGYGKGWDLVKTEFLSTIKRLKNTGYEITYISKEVTGEVKLKNGSTITTYKPNIPDKVANVLAGTVGATFHLVADEKERYLSCEMDSYVFSGGRYNFDIKKIPLDKDVFLKELDIAISKGIKPIKSTPGKNPVKEETPPEVKKETEVKKEDEVKPEIKSETAPDPTEAEKPPKRTRRHRTPKVTEETASFEQNSDVIPLDDGETPF
ncbi:MAG: AAA family ATPase [Clostridia bacterium]